MGERLSRNPSIDKYDDTVKLNVEDIENSDVNDPETELLEIFPRELTIEEEILGVLDIIPVSSSFILARRAAAFEFVLP